VCRPGSEPSLQCAARAMPEIRHAAQELDEAARRRLPKQLYIPLPCGAARRQMLDRGLSALLEYAWPCP